MNTSEHGWVTIDEDTGIWIRSYGFGAGTANTFVVRLGPGRLMAVSPGCKVPPAALDELAEHGEVVALVAPNGYHHLGLCEWLERFPTAKLYAPGPAAKRIAKQYRDRSLSFGSIDDLASELPEHVHVFAPPMRHPDVFVRVDTEAGAAWFSNDVLSNSPELPKHWLIGFLFKITRSGPGFSVNRLVLKVLGGSKAAFRSWLVDEMKAHPPHVLVPGHGDVLRGEDLGSRTMAVLEAGL